ncbi:hypothetical protein HO133_005169 [Letharia lupina]|uniref:NADAR domain-containing protein n=1 Tax=Letharia lupina TaxID=560253 RepID=A0A8H6C9I8_9LECA|nr:uncharacterized protein HO133_005169 [Letharia lupina]KAF6219344.1 hypothetical protein HO133_005169 [Letharia lupina]
MAQGPRWALLMSDDAVAEKILVGSGPAEAKALSREMSNFDQEVWDANCNGNVEEGNLLKFQRNENLKDVLLAPPGLGMCGNESD